MQEENKQNMTADEYMVNIMSQRFATAVARHEQEMARLLTQLQMAKQEVERLTELLESDTPPETDSTIIEDAE